jgi:hypothetical protein
MSPWANKPVDRKVAKAWFESRFEKAGLSMRGAARELDIDPSSMNQFLAGTRDLKIREALALARLLDEPLVQILVRAGYPEARRFQ